jgi:hypothetical protein
VPPGGGGGGGGVVGSAGLDEVQRQVRDVQLHGQHQAIVALTLINLQARHNESASELVN